MFDSPKYILYFLSQTIQVATVTGTPPSQKVVKKEEIPWTKETLSQTLIGIKKKFGAACFIMVDDDLAFTFGIVIPTDTKDERSFIRIKASESVPEEVDDFGWDYKEVLETVDKKNKIVQFASLDNQFYQSLSKAVRDSGIKIEAMEPMTCSLARLLAKKTEPTLVIHQAKKYLMLFSYQGLVFSVESSNAEPTPDAIPKFLKFIQETFGLATKAAFLSGEFKVLGSTTPEFAGWNVEAGNLDPFSGMAARQDGSRADLNILLGPPEAAKDMALENSIVGISENGAEPGMGQYEPIGLDAKDLQKRKQERVINLIILGASLLVLLVNGIILYQRSQVEKILEGGAVPTQPAER